MSGLDEDYEYIFEGEAGPERTYVGIKFKVPLSDDEADQLQVLLDSFVIFRTRSKRHGDTWKDSGWRGSLFDIRKKVDRLWNEFMVGDGSKTEDLDSALDAITFLGFFVRARQENIEGVWRWK